MIRIVKSSAPAVGAGADRRGVCGWNVCGKVVRAGTFWGAWRLRRPRCCGRRL